MKKELQNPLQFEIQLTNEKQKELLNWISANFNKIKTINKYHSSYSLKHVFELSKKGFYITNGEFIGAMIKAGFNCKPGWISTNFNFNISEKSLAFKKKW